MFLKYFGDLFETGNSWFIGQTMINLIVIIISLQVGVLKDCFIERFSLTSDTDQ